MKLPLLFTTFKKDLMVIERVIEEASSSQSAFMRETTGHLLKSGGKRIRPIFGMLCGKLGDYDIEKVKYPAAALELIHSASLAHDDVIDCASMRRGVATISAKWDNHVATYTGDYIFAHAMQLISQLNNPLAHQIVSKAIVEVCLGEIDQIHDKYRFDQSLRSYLRRIKRKTALLIAISGQLGAIAANVPASVHQNLYLFGYYVGMSFQITDDILDFTASEKELGKPAGSDLAQGNITLPTLYAMQDESLSKRIVEINATTDKLVLAQIIEDIRSSGAIEKSYALSQRYLNLAFAVLDRIPSKKQKKNLIEIANFIGKRTY